MTWNYRVMKRVEHGEEIFGIHEVYEEPSGHTENAERVEGESVEDLRLMLCRMIAALDKPVLEYK